MRVKLIKTMLKAVALFGRKIMLKIYPNGSRRPIRYKNVNGQNVFSIMEDDNVKYTRSSCFLINIINSFVSGLGMTL